ncbi:RagB/SusD family nutrient uptake outer membrane protein [Pedobacter sp. FW305-3-2-15-E-R2A2]|uniref:RagB/SusD family nutrient uptake outer membrane protein n=1 Tax=Pedobacter sp. FW305-3-2-15-E-R2A2 TaxID=3140251 RepID=UPI0031401A55
MKIKKKKDERNIVFFAKIFFIIIAVLSLASCKKYLDLKPNASLYVASSLRDCQALLDDYSVMNLAYPVDGEASSDNYYLTDASWSSLPDVEAQETYIWALQAQHRTSQWSAPYKAVFNSNLVLQLLEKISPSSGSDYNAIKGAALFFRGYSFFNIASLFCKPFDAASAQQDPGIPIRQSTDVEVEDDRGTVQQTYNQIIQDLKTAFELLPETSPIKSRPTKTAALAALARVYLAMGDYKNAGEMADACLKKYNILLDFKLINSSAPFPFSRFNTEVIFSASMPPSSSLTQNNAKILKSLYDSYDVNDIRKTAFFRANTGINIGTFAFKGSYDGSSNLFCGFATDEVYLIRAECYARDGKITEALKDLNDLLITRWKDQTINGITTTTYTKYVTSSADVALGFVLNERRKELIFRGIRWTDLRRLNRESQFSVILNRSVNGNSYTLPPNDLKYTLLIPRDVISNSSISQNPR